MCVCVGGAYLWVHHFRQRCHEAPREAGLLASRGSAGGQDAGLP